MSTTKAAGQPARCLTDGGETGRIDACGSPQIFWNPQVLKHYLAGIQFALGDLYADATPTRMRQANRSNNGLHYMTVPDCATLTRSVSEDPRLRFG